MQQGLANVADLGCMASGLIEGWFGRNDPFTQAAKAGCGMGNQLRDSMTNSLAGAARQGSGIIQRPTPGGQDDRQTMQPQQSADDQALDQMHRDQDERNRVVRSLLAQPAPHPYEPFDRYGHPIQ